MVLIDDVESFDAEQRSLSAVVRITPASPFFVRGGGAARGGVPSWAAIEYMAQTSAALTGRLELVVSPDAQPRPGFLLGTRRLVLDLERFEDGESYHVRAVMVYSDGATAAFDCTITDGSGRVVASASLNAFRPPDDLLASLSKEQGTRHQDKS